MQTLYFAYGSNLCASRLRGRVPSAVAVGRARLPGRRLVTDKLGRDGSGKANLREDAAATVWGVIYEIHSAHWAELDACERGYSRVSLGVVAEAGACLLAQRPRIPPLPPLCDRTVSRKLLKFDIVNPTVKKRPKRAPPPDSET
jgi:hypothetical protein